MSSLEKSLSSLSIISLSDSASFSASFIFEGTCSLSSQLIILQETMPFLFVQQELVGMVGIVLDQHMLLNPEVLPSSLVYITFQNSKPIFPGYVCVFIPIHMTNKFFSCINGESSAFCLTKILKGFNKCFCVKSNLLLE